MLAALAGTELTALERAFLRDAAVAGVTLFRRNIASRFYDVRALCEAIRAAIPQALIAVDQEGGRVSRLPRPFPNDGVALSLAEGKCDAEAQRYLRNYGFTVGATLAALGINVNFAPVCDIRTNPGNPVIGDRAFGDSAEDVAARAGAFLAGLDEAGILGCLKHFPGQGDGGVDTHLGSDVIHADLATLESRELHPFRMLLRDAPMIMISHSIFPAWDNVPASLSRIIMTDVLRKELGFQGLILSDDMNMKAIGQDDATWKNALITAIANGADLVLVCEGLDRCRMAAEALQAEAKKSNAFAERVRQSLERVKRVREVSPRLA